MTAYSFEIPGKPFAKERPRFYQGRAITPKNTRAYEKMVGQMAGLIFKEPLAGPVKVSIIAIFQTPKSWSKKKTNAHLGRHHVQKPDLDNVAKTVMDGMNGIAFLDDSQVAETECTKLWGVEAKTVVVIRKLGWE